MREVQIKSFFYVAPQTYIFLFVLQRKVINSHSYLRVIICFSFLITCILFSFIVNNPHLPVTLVRQN